MAVFEVRCFAFGIPARVWRPIFQGFLRSLPKRTRVVTGDDRRNQPS